MREDQNIKVRHVIAGNYNSAAGRNVLRALPISAHQEIENWNQNGCKYLVSAICT
jgi:hypothetical protein